LKNIQIDCVLNIKSSLGEGPIWSTIDQKLYWVDITEGLFCNFNPQNGINKILDLGRPIGCFALKKDGNAIVALTDGFFELNQKTQKLTLIKDTESDILSNRFNDGTVDLKGRFYAGTMPIKNPGIENSPKGTLYCLDQFGNVKKVMDGFHIINGLAFSPDAKIAYVSDSAYWVRTIWAYDYDLENAIWSNKRIFFDTKNLNGRPDGGCVDSDGCYWMAGVSGWELVRITPKGEVDMIIKMPIEKPTKIAFGGPNLDIIYVTSIGINGITRGTEKTQPLAGSIFSLTIPGVQGVEFPFYN
jgi:sugar lactone lactonase YvrE